jgi:hypothetical protein
VDRVAPAAHATVADRHVRVPGVVQDAGRPAAA